MAYDKVSGAKNAVQSMLFYHMYAMIENGVKDPKQVLASEIAEMASLSEEQVSYVLADIASGNKVMETLSYAVRLLDGMDAQDKVDHESIRIVTGLLRTMESHCREALEKPLQAACTDAVQQ